MSQRVNFAQQSPNLFKKFLAFTHALGESTMDAKLIDLVSIRTSQLNGCEFCLGLHITQAKKHGESELRMNQVATWRESALFTPRECAALTWTEILTHLPEDGVPIEVYDDVRE
ncbi:carboxymuconolactone decarboxylase family protein [Paenibacillus sp. BC26]|uniref:carboxymuconolactone decarboxylase family protein n=1 Tax=Paenibacillus sp. BC26 TaxID=1881032 RepID=UPI000A774B5F|nr:carboxymuconolactone decarboxylase family protein [Paenibacillus sp. BC26]